MELIVNGEARVVENVSSVADMLSTFKLENKILVVEVNRSIVDRSQYSETPLSNGDRVEIVHFVGGG
ncbi:sulfur carrier protein ThiS [Paenibacillus aurantius]|uniref:Sulfur carrier protein ThiS n=1 Tax=Paenibacillus aurantius TaxID=2918900 RepID=A0AA96LFS6_9BACL|nr:sulfur carrier protein ThiS [Paenibacillus aurantius]WNQ12458.1 sulfur carrier protein ThiS [Paenibacillus aurantius]